MGLTQSNTLGIYMNKLILDEPILVSKICQKEILRYNGTIFKGLKGAIPIEFVKNDSMDCSVWGSFNNFFVIYRDEFKFSVGKFCKLTNTTNQPISFLDNKSEIISHFFNHFLNNDLEKEENDMNSEDNLKFKEILLSFMYIAFLHLLIIYAVISMTEYHSL